MSIDASEALLHPHAVAFVGVDDIPEGGVNHFGFRHNDEEQVHIANPYSAPSVCFAANRVVITRCDRFGVMCFWCG